MASIYFRPKSPYVWIRFKDETGKWRDRATDYRKDNIGEVRQAKLIARNMGRQEREKRPLSSNEHWDHWVDRWIFDSYGGSTKSGTWTRYMRGWRQLRLFMEEQGLSCARQLSYRQKDAYLEWRQEHGAGKNTAIQEVKLLSLIVKESCRRFGGENPFVRMGLRKDDPKEKAIWTDAEVARVAAAISAQPHWMRCTFVLGFYQAARLRQIPRLQDIDLSRGRITYHYVKGGRSKRFTHPIDDGAIELLRCLIEERLREQPAAVSLCDMPLLASVEWRAFLDSIGLPHLVHHGLRSTWITKAALRGVVMAQAKRFVNHGSTAVHEIYQRLSADDVADVPLKMGLPKLTL